MSSHLQNGIETAKFVWSRLPNYDADEADDRDGLSTESLDYEIVENFAYKEQQAKRGKLFIAYHASVRWFLSLLIGIGTALAAVFINISVENFAGWKFAATFAIIQKSYFTGFLVYLLVNLVLVFSSVYIVTQFAPAAAGSGIPEIKGYLNGVDAHGILLFRTLMGKIFGSIGSVGGGLALGKEGPLVHIGACIASLLGQGGSTKYHLHSRWLQFFQSDRDRRDLVTCGCAAGVAAAFRAPVGGVLFALEEVTSWWRSQLMWRVFFTSAIVAVMVRTVMGWCESGKCGHFGSGGFIIWDVSDGQEDYSFVELLPMAVIGVIGGLLGALFNQLTLYITYWRRNHLHKNGKKFKIVEVCIISLVTSAISFGLPILRRCSVCPESDLSSGIDCPRPPGMYGNYVNFYCRNDNEYNDLATIFFNTQDDAIRNLFSAKTIHEFSAKTLLTFLVIDVKTENETSVIGIILRSYLLVILHAKIDFRNSPLLLGPRWASGAIRHELSEFVKPVSSKGLSVHEIELSADDMDKYIDLAPFVNPSPYLVPEDMSLSKVYNLFRQLGLRHLFVVPRPSNVTGIITRKDLLMEDTEDPPGMELHVSSVRGGGDEINNKKNIKRPLLYGLHLGL